MDTLGQLTNFIESHFHSILTTSLLCIIAVPLVIWLIPSIFECNDSRSFFGVSADGLLTYIGAIFSGLMSLLVAIVALVQGKRVAEADDERVREARRNEVRPSLQIEVKADKERSFSLTIENLCDYAALDVYLFTAPFVRVVSKGRKIKKKFSIGYMSPNIFVVDESECSLNANGLPKELFFCFEDVDGNTWTQEFRYNVDGYFSSDGATLA